MSTKASTNENAVQPADPKKENETTILNELSQIIISYFPNNQFDEDMIHYICKMIYIDRPDNESDLKNLIGDYLSDQLRYPEDKTLSICKEIFQKSQLVYLSSLIQTNLILQFFVLTMLILDMETM